MRAIKYNIESGEVVNIVDGTDLILQQEDGFAWMELVVDMPDWNTTIVKDGVLVSRPPSPGLHYYWTRNAWEPNVTAIAEKHRSYRNELLQQSDWIVTKALETGQSVPAEWVLYRQALRDISEQQGWPLEVEWPQQPM